MSDKSNTGNLLPKDALDKCAEKFQGRSGYTVKDINSQDIYVYNGDDRFPTASIFKLPVLVVLFREAEAGRIDLSQRKCVTDDICTHGTGMLRMLHDNPELSLLDFSRLMIAVSDNIATDVIVRALGEGKINQSIQKLGLKNTHVMEIGRWHYGVVGMENEPTNAENDKATREKMLAQKYLDDGWAYSDSPENLVSSPNDLCLLLDKLYSGDLAGPESTRMMLDILKTCTATNRIREPLKREIEVAHKIGGSRRISTDAGILFLSTGPLIVSAFTLADDPGTSGAAWIADMTRITVGAVSPSDLI